MLKLVNKKEPDLIDLDLIDRDLDFLKGIPPEHGPKIVPEELEMETGLPVGRQGLPAEAQTQPAPDTLRYFTEEMATPETVPVEPKPSPAISIFKEPPRSVEGSYVRQILEKKQLEEPAVSTFVEQAVPKETIPKEKKIEPIPEKQAEYDLVPVQEVARKASEEFKQRFPEQAARMSDEDIYNFYLQAGIDAYNKWIGEGREKAEAGLAKVKEKRPEAQISEAPEKTLSQRILEQITPFKAARTEQIAQAQNIQAIAKQTDLPVSVVRENYPELMNETLKRQSPTTLELIELGIAPYIAMGLSANAARTLLGLATFVGVSEVINGAVSLIKDEDFQLLASKGLSNLAPEESSQLTRELLDIAEFIVAGLAAHGVYKMAPRVAEKLTKDIFTEFKAPRKIQIPADRVASVFRTGKEISPEELDLIKSLNLKGSQYRAAVKRGLEIEISAEKITKIVDKPYWSRLKSVFGRGPSEPVVSIVTGERIYRTPPAGLLEKPLARPPEKAKAEKPVEAVPGIKKVEIETAKTEKPVEPIVTPPKEEKVKKPKSVKMTVYRGVRPKLPGKEYASDPGDFGRGIYYTTNKSMARAYGIDKKIETIKLELKNPLQLTEEEAYDLAEKYNTLGHGVDEATRIKNAERMTKDLLAQGYDGIISTDKRGFKEIVDFRPYLAQKPPVVKEEITPEEKIEGMKEKPYEIGDVVEYREASGEWTGIGKIEGYRAGDIDEGFQRIDIRPIDSAGNLIEGRLIRGAHPKSVRKATEQTKAKIEKGMKAQKRIKEQNKKAWLKEQKFITEGTDPRTLYKIYKEPIWSIPVQKHIANVKKFWISRREGDAGIPAWNDDFTEANFDDLALKAHKKSIEKALASGKPVPAEVLAEYPELAKEKPAEKPSEAPKIKEKLKVEITGKGKEKTVEVPEAEGEKLSLKEQKQYLIKEIDTAIKAAKHEEIPWGEKPTLSQLVGDSPGAQEIYQKLKKKYGTVTIEVPGDGKFTVLNTKQSLEQFKKVARRFPTVKWKITEPGKKPVKVPSPMGKRMTDVEYYNPFRPRKQKIITAKHESQRQYYVNGYYSQGHYMVKTKSKPESKFGFEKVTEVLEKSAKELRAGIKKAVPARIVAETFHVDDLTVEDVAEGRYKNIIPRAHVVSEDGKHFLYNAHYIDVILTEHPAAKIFVVPTRAKGEQVSFGTLFFKKGKEVVGVVAPIGYEEKVSGKLKDMPKIVQRGYAELTGKAEPEEVEAKPEIEKKALDEARAKSIVREELITKRGGKEIGEEAASKYSHNEQIVNAAKERLEYYNQPELKTDKDFNGVRTRLKAFLKGVEKKEIKARAEVKEKKQKVEEKEAPVEKRPKVKAEIEFDPTQPAYAEAVIDNEGIYKQGENYWYYDGKTAFSVPEPPRQFTAKEKINWAKGLIEKKSIPEAAKRKEEMRPKEKPPAEEKFEVEEFKFDPNSTKNEGRWRLKDPAEFEKGTYFRRKSSTEGVSYVMAKHKESGKVEVQAIRFNKNILSEKDAAEWWAENKHRFERTWTWGKEKPEELTAEKMAIIGRHVKDLGSIKAVRERYPGNTEVDKYAMELAETLYGKERKKARVKTVEEELDEYEREREERFEVERVRKRPKILAANFKNLKQPKSEDFQLETDKIIRREEIARNISERLNVPIRRGKFRGKKLGIYKTGKEIIRIKAGSIQTISHEIGHYLDEIIPDVFASKISNKKLNPLLKEYDIKPGTPKHKEAFSEFLRFYITEPVKAQRTAPGFYKYFKKTIKKYPEIEDVLLTARKDYSRWLKMPSTAKILSHISMQKDKIGIKEKALGTIEDLYETTLDDLYPLKRFVDLAKERKVEVAGEENPYVLARVLKGWVSKANVFLEKGTFNKKFWEKKGSKIIPVFKGKSFKQIMRPIEREKALEDFNIYLTARRIIELDKRNINTGIDVKDARAALKELEAKHPDFFNAAQELYKFQDAVLEYGYQCGLYDSETLSKIKKLNRNYAPFYRVFEELQSKGYFGKRYAALGSQLKRIKGSEREIVNPLESIVKNTYLIINAGDRNQVAVMMANLAAKDKELTKLFEEIPTPMAKVATVDLEQAIPAKILSDAGIKPGDLPSVIDIFRPSLFLPQDNVISVLMNGKKKFFQVDPKLYKALMATDREEMGLLVKILSMPTRWLRAGAILTPEFAVRNPLRDVMTAFVYSKYGFVPVVDNIRGIFSLVKKDKDYWLWRMAGGEHSMLVSMDREYLQKSFDEIVKGKGVTNYIKSPLEVLRIVSEVSEKINRLPEAKKALARGKSPIEAAFAARDITLDFAKGGATGRTLNRIIPFWKAWALGWEKMIAEFKNRPTVTTFKAMVGITLPSIVLYLINRDDPRYKEIPQWQKDLFWIIFTKDEPNWNKLSEKEKKEQLSLINMAKYGIYRIPRPFELGILFGAIPERVLEYIDNKDPYVIKQLAKDILYSQSPGVIPTALAPLIENWTNYDFFLDRPVVPASREALPPEAQYTGYTSETAKKLGEIFNYPPAKIDNIFSGYFAGLGRHATDQLDKILRGTGISPDIPQPTKTLADKPVIRAFVIRRPIGSASESVNRFYETLKEYTGHERMMKEYIKNNEREKFYNYRDKHPEVFLSYDWEGKNFYSIPARYYRQIADIMSKLRKTERQIYKSKTISSEDKRIKINQIDEEITKLAQKALEFTPTSKRFKEEAKKD